MKILLIGLGVMGSNHLRVLKMLLPENNILIYDKNKKILNLNLKKKSKKFKAKIYLIF